MKHINDRYVPKGYRSGNGWGIWDRKENRYVTDDELKTISIDTLKNEQLDD